MFHEFIYEYQMMLTYLHKHVGNITLIHPILYSEEFVKSLYMCKRHITAFFNLDMSWRFYLDILFDQVLCVCLVQIYLD